MPRVRTAQQEGLGQHVASAGRTPALPVGASPGAFGAGLGEELGRLGRIGFDAGERVERAIADQHRRDQTIAAHKAGLDAQLAWHSRLRELQQGAPAGAAGFTDSVRAEFQAYKADLLKGTQGELAKAMLEERLGSLEMGLVDDAARFEDRARLAHAKTQLEGTLDSALSLVLLKPESYAATLRDHLEMVEQTTLPPDEKAEAARKITHALTEAHVRGQIQDNPGAVHGLLTGSNVPGLSMQSRLELIRESRAEANRREDQAREDIRFKWAQQSHAEAQADRAREAYGAQLTADVLAGRAGTAHIDKALRTRVLSSSEGRALHSLLREQGERAEEGPKRDDFAVLATLLEMQREGDPALRAEALRAREKGLITTGSMATLLRDDERAGEQGGVLARADVKDAREMLSKSIKPQGLMATLDPDQGEAVVRAEQRFLERMRADPKADPYKVANEEVDRFKGRTPPAPAPQRSFVVRTPDGKVDGMASLTAIKAALAAKEITDEEAQAAGEELERLLPAGEGT